MIPIGGIQMDPYSLSEQATLRQAQETRVSHGQIELLPSGRRYKEPLFFLPASTNMVNECMLCFCQTQGVGLQKALSVGRSVGLSVGPSFPPPTSRGGLA